MGLRLRMIQSVSLLRQVGMTPNSDRQIFSNSYLCRHNIVSYGFINTGCTLRWFIGYLNRPTELLLHDQGILVNYLHKF